MSVLRTQGVANLRTLEQKISDAGPNPQRVQPHILTPVKTAMVAEGRVMQRTLNGGHWFHLPEESPDRVASRLDVLSTLWKEFTNPQVTRRTGQALEIAIFRAILAADGIIPLGGFADLNAHDDSKLYSKQEIHNFNGRTLGNQALDFIVALGGDFCGIEAKNIRPWLYPHEQEVRDAVRKARTLDVIPVIIARRIPFVTFRVLGTCGVILHEVFNQHLANTDADLAARASEKTLLGYHDIRVGNMPDARMTRFMSENLPRLVTDARGKLAIYGDLLDAFVSDNMSYREFAARVRRRERGQKEDNDWPDSEPRGYEEADPYDDE